MATRKEAFENAKNGENLQDDLDSMLEDMGI